MVLASSAGAAAPSSLPTLGPAPNFALTTQQNDRVWLTQLRDRAVVLTFGCTTCASCPSVLPALAELAGRLGGVAGRRVFFIVVSVDPRHDTPRVLRQFLRDRGLAPAAWLLLTGTPAEIDVVTRRYEVGVVRRDDQVTHDCRVVLIDGRGTIRASYDAATLGRLPTELEALLTQP
jgi:protein SCO1/2